MALGSLRRRTLRASPGPLPNLPAQLPASSEGGRSARKARESLTIIW